MAKTEKSQVIQIDQVGVVLTLLVLALSTFQFLSIELNQNISLIVLALSSLVASSLYFLRIREMTESSQTPLSDTLVVLGGIYLALSLVLEVFSDQNLSIGWSLLFIGLGIFGRLFLLDTGIITLIDGIQSIFSRIFEWAKSSIVNTLRVGFLLLAVVLYFIALPAIQAMEPALSSFLMALFFLSGFINKEIATRRLRVLFFLVSVLGVFFSVGGLLSDGYSIDGLSNLALFTSILAWSVTYPTITSFTLRVFSFLKTFITGVYEIFSKLITQVVEYPIRTLRITLNLIAFVMLVIGIFTFNGQFILIAIALFLISYIDLILPKIPDLLRGLWEFIYGIAQGLYNFLKKIYLAFVNEPIKSIRRLSLVLALVSILVLPEENSLDLIVSLIFLGIAILPSVLPSVYRFFKTITLNVYQSFKTNPIGTLQVTSLFLAIFLYIVLPSDRQLAGYNQRLLLSGTFAVLAVLPTLIDILKSLLPAIQELIINIWTFLINTARNLNTMFWIILIFSSYQLITLPVSSKNIRIFYAILAGISLTFVGNSYFARFVDSLQLAFIRIFDSIIGIFGFIRGFIRWQTIQSFLAVILLIMGITTWFIPTEYENGTTRITLIIISIILWNTAGKERIERFINFFKGLYTTITHTLTSLVRGTYNLIRRLITGLVSNLYNLANWALRNIFVLALIILGLGFFMISFGLLFPGSSQIVATIFGNVLDNRLVSFIIGAFFGGLGIITMQQAFVRRTNLQVNGGKN